MFASTMRALYPIVCSVPREREMLTHEILNHVALTLQSFPKHIRYALLLGTMIWGAVPALIPKNGGRTFARLSEGRRQEWFDRFWQSQNPVVHQFIKALKGTLVLAHYENPWVKQQMNYQPETWIAQARHKRWAQWGEDIARAQGMVSTSEPLLSPERLLHKGRHG